MALQYKAISLLISNSRTGFLIKFSSYMSPLPHLLSSVCGAHTQKITKNIYYISNDKVKVDTDLKTMKMNRSSKKPVCIMLSWLMSTPKQIMNYANLYLEDGFDVIRVICEPWQLVWPRKGTQIIGRDLIKLMAANEGSYVVHGFSVGGYVWSEALVHALKENKIYQPALNRVKAQVWDSVADITAVAVGLPIALFPCNKPARHATKLFINFYLLAFRSVATRHYERACETYYATPCRAPALFLLSSSDPVGQEDRIRRAHNLWLDMGIQCTLQCWPNSNHVMHYLSHRDEYVALVRAHIRNNMCTTH
ncbi:uncharacterized protein LOC126776872 [Nymphalis io]|uniref:uncharacterized protein LOC126776872 n=1 Tax=Inachis io TaxID=171585 RepID=UPI00216A7E78|nr:uncharacterized protein LOC126776872 [Nymphalis io]